METWIKSVTDKLVAGPRKKWPVAFIKQIQFFKLQGLTQMLFNKGSQSCQFKTSILYDIACLVQPKTLGFESAGTNLQLINTLQLNRFSKQRLFILQKCPTTSKCWKYHFKITEMQNYL